MKYQRQRTKYVGRLRVFGQYTIIASSRLCTSFAFMLVFEKTQAPVFQERSDTASKNMSLHFASATGVTMEKSWGPFRSLCFMGTCLKGFTDFIPVTGVPQNLGVDSLHLRRRAMSESLPGVCKVRKDCLPDNYRGHMAQILGKSPKDQYN